MLEDFYLLREEECAFLSFSLWVWNWKLIRLCYTWPCQMLTLRDSLSLYRVHHPPAFLCGFFFFPGTQEIWLPDFQQMLLSLSTGLAIFSHHPVLSFSAFALTRRSVVGVRCLHKRAKGWKKGHGSESLGCHLLETHFLGHPKQNGRWWFHPLWNATMASVCSVSQRCSAPDSEVWIHSMEWLLLENADKNSLNSRASNQGFVQLWVQWTHWRRDLQVKGWQKEEESPGSANL